MLQVGKFNSEVRTMTVRKGDISSLKIASLLQNEMLHICTNMYNNYINLVFKLMYISGRNFMMLL